MQIKACELMDDALKYAASNADRLYYSITMIGDCCDASINLSIIEREKISTRFLNGSISGIRWMAYKSGNNRHIYKFCCYGNTMIEAGLRCFVWSVLGEYVEIPEELI